MTEMRLGIDIGALFVKVVRQNSEKVTHNLYRAHLGHPVLVLHEMLQELPEDEYSVGITGSGAKLVTSPLDFEPVHSIEAQITAVREKFGGARNILNVGGGSATIIYLDENGKFLNYSANSLCAAGTGSFLDEQARRLEITYDSMRDFVYDGFPPSIASRCAVFAKSDLIHRQQEGYSKKAMWAGLCKGCVDTFLQTLLKGKPLSGLTVFTGGVAQNRSIVHWLKNYYGEQVVSWDEAHMAGAQGAAMMSNGDRITLQRLIGTQSAESAADFKKVKRGAPLLLDRSDYPSFEVLSEYVDDMENEVRIWRETTGDLDVALGIDIGSTSTKLVLLDHEDKVVLDIYRKTLGDPLGAVKKLFIAVEKLMKETGTRFLVTACGTTGSGRKFIGQIIGADRIINEISAHVAGAMKTDPQVDTIFEIGGQDSKYMRTVNGSIRDANMNFICAAGTGSFVEEQASKLGFAVSRIGDAVMGIAPPETSDRCTVFMEEDTNKLLRQGFSPVDALAAVLNSVVKNYLNKVVGNRYVSKKKVFFQGATARNKGLVAAFENLLDVEVVVSSLCHQMGSYGVALLTGEYQKQNKLASTFRGFGLHRKKIELVKEQCEACNNQCQITFARIENETERPSWGYMCGKEATEEKRKVNRQFSLFRTRDKFLRRQYNKQTVPENSPMVGLPASLTTFSFLPFWTVFFNSVGWRVELSEQTNERIKNLGTQSGSGDFCFPIKVAIGHALEVMDNPEADRVLIPQVISNKPNEFTSNSHYCPYVQSHTSVMRSIYSLKGVDHSKLLAPVLDFRWDFARMLREFLQSLGDPLEINKSEMKRALQNALAAQDEFDKACQTEGAKALKEISESGERAIVIAGRPYNCFDTGSNLGLPEKISEYGYKVIPIDFMPFKPENLGDSFKNIYWNYGQRILGALQTVAKEENLFAVYLSNFNCGPDSFLLSYSEHLMGEKPLLILELDEHGADAGYLTRVEAFLDVVSKGGQTAPGRPIQSKPIVTNDLKGRTLWLPPMHPIAGEMAVGNFKRFGYKAEVLPFEDRESYELGRAAVRGSECLPTSVTIGVLLQKLEEINAVGSEHAFFMATASGPCRFGQYALLHRMILNRHGYEDMLILSPSSYNSYQGLEEKLRRELWYGFLVADVMYKMQCKIRPYEKNPGETNRLTKKEIYRIKHVLATNGDLEKAMRQCADYYAAIPTTDEEKPLVGVVGEIYVRCNGFSNGYVIDHIEKYGGEAWLAPLSEWFLYTAHLQEWSAKQYVRNFTARGKSLLKNRFLFSAEHKVYSWCEKVLFDRREPPIKDVVDQGRRFMPINFEGEAIITIGRAIEFIRQGASLVVNCAPFGCMPGTLTSSIFQQVENEMGIPVVSMYYDGEGEINKRLEVYIHQARSAGKAPAAAKHSLGHAG